MSVCIVIQSGGVTATGTDVVPDALDFDDIVSYIASGSTDSQTITGIDTPIVVRAEWTTSGDATRGVWSRNGVSAGASASSPVDVTVNAGNSLIFNISAASGGPSNPVAASGVVTVLNRNKRATVTMTVASPCVVSWTGHGLAAGAKVRFSTTGALPTGITAGTVYFVIAAGLGADVFEISATSGGSAINTSGTQSGVHTGESVLDTFSYYVERTGGGTL